MWRIGFHLPTRWDGEVLAVVFCRNATTRGAFSLIAVRDSRQAISVNLEAIKLAPRCVVAKNKEEIDRRMRCANERIFLTEVVVWVCVVEPIEKHLDAVVPRSSRRPPLHVPK